MDRLLREYATRAAAFEKDAHEILGRHEQAKSRVVILEETYAKLDELSVDQDELMRQALRCVEQGLYRAAHVMAWAAFIDFYERILASDNLNALRNARPAWSRTSTVEELREYQSEHSLIDLAQPLGIASKNEMKALQGLLNKRNQCAHPSSFKPGLNDALGYISELLHYFRLLQGRTPNST